MSNHTGWTNQDYIKLFEIILNVSISKEIVFVTEKSNKGRLVSKLMNKNTNESFKAIHYLTLIKQRLGNNCFEDYTPEAICEKLPEKTLDSLYIQLVNTKIIRKYLSSLMLFDDSNFAKIFMTAHKKEWESIKATISSHEKILSHLLELCGMEEYNGVFKKETIDICNKLKNALINPCMDEGFVYKQHRSSFEVKCPRCSFLVKYNYTDQSVLQKMNVSDQYSSLCSQIKNEYDLFLSIKETAFKAGTLLKEMRDSFINRLQCLLNESSRKNKRSIEDLIESLNNISYSYERSSNSFVLFEREFPAETILNDPEYVTKEIRNEIDRQTDQIKNDIAMEKHFIDTLQNSSCLTIALRCIHANDKYGKSTYTELLKGSKSKRMTEYGLNDSPYYGILNRFTKVSIEEMIDSLLEQELIEKYYGNYDRYKRYPKLRLTKDGDQALADPAMIKNEFPLGNIEVEKIYKTMDISTCSETEFMDLMEFVITKPSEYKDDLEGLITSFQNVPEKYIPIIEMNAGLKTGVVKKTLNIILQSVKEGDVA